MQKGHSTPIWLTLSGIAAACFGLSTPVAGQTQPSPQVIGHGGEGQACVTSPLGSTTVATLNSTPLVTVFANGTPLVLILDTGAQRTVVNPGAANRIRGEMPRVEFQRGINGLVGALAAREVELRSYRIGGVQIPWHRVTVAPIATPRIFSTGLDGVLGVDVLSAFDIDLDLPQHHQMTLYGRGRCNGPSWSGRYAKIEAGRSRSDHLFFPVTLDNHRLTAIIDTGAQNTVLSKTVARRLGVGETALARDRSVKTKGAAGEELESRVHKFGHLEIASMTIRNPEIVVTDIRLHDADIVLGMDFLRTRRLWLSYASFQIFVAEPSPSR